ncbi:MAG: hypothetical protein WKF43_05435 [Acidimicrobiales bacterium]
MLWFERQVVGALTEGLDHEKQDAIAAYVGGALGALPDHIRLGVGAQSVALGAWARGRAILGAGAGSSVDVGSFEVSRLAPVRQYVRALRSLVLFAEHELTPGAGG